MFFFLSDAITRLFIQELRQYWQYHPKYKTLVDHIQGKFSFRERPQQGIIVKSGGGSSIPLSADNYRGIVYSYTHLAKLTHKPGVSVEWVREDGVAIQNNGGIFPSPPGVYYLDIQEENEKPVFYVDPLLDVTHEQVTLLDGFTGQLIQPPLAGSLRLFEIPSGFLYVEGTNYTLELDPAGKPTGKINLTNELTGGRWLQADYRTPGTTVGPFEIRELHANNIAIPGVVLAFGRKVEPGDQLAVVVESSRRPASLEYGGRWEMSVEIDIFARDVYDQREIADQSIIYLFGVARNRLSSQGIEIMNASLGGESEEIYDETGDDYFYNATLSLTAETEWSVYIPLNVSLRQVAPLTSEQAKYIAGLSDDELAGQDGNIQLLSNLGLETFRDPFFSVGKRTFETLK